MLWIQKRARYVSGTCTCQKAGSTRRGARCHSGTPDPLDSEDPFCLLEARPADRAKLASSGVADTENSERNPI